MTGLVLRRPINISASFFLLTWTSDGCHGVGGRPAKDRRAAPPSFINVHHLNVIRHPVALVRVDTIRLELKLLVKGVSKKDVETTFEAIRMMHLKLEKRLVCFNNKSSVNHSVIEVING